MSKQAKIVVFGASGLIGEATCSHLLQDGMSVTPIARHFTLSQKDQFAAGREVDFIGLSPDALSGLIGEANVVVNCVGALQDSSSGQTDAVHTGFVSTLLAAFEQLEQAPLLVQISIPGDRCEDTTAFARTKRSADELITSSLHNHIILRPGFVFADRAFGGSALLRAVAALPVGLSDHFSARPFATTAINDITGTVAHVSKAYADHPMSIREVWDVMSDQEETVGSVLNLLRKRCGGPPPLVSLPSWLMDLSGIAGDLVSRLGWRPPVRSTAISEMKRGVSGNPERWMTQTGIRPLTMPAAIQHSPATIQDKWFSRLYLLKAVIVGTLSLFWIVSGMIALTVGFEPATVILTSNGVPPAFASMITAITAFMDVAIGLAIGIRKTHVRGLFAGVALSLGYLIASFVLTPDLWLDPLGPLVKVIPATTLMVVAWAISDER